MVSRNKKTNKKKNVVLQVNKAVSSKKDPVFDATSKFNEKNGRRGEGANRPLRVVFVRFPRSLLHLVQTFFSGANDSAVPCNSQNSLLQLALEEDPHFANQVKSLELMLRVRERLQSSAAADATVRVPDEPAGFAGETDLMDAALVPAARSLVSDLSGEDNPEDAELVVRRPDGDDGLEDDRSVRVATASESKGIIGSLQRYVSELSFIEFR